MSRSPHPTPADATPPKAPPAAWLAGYLLVAIAAVLVPMLSVPAVVVILILSLSFPSESSQAARRLGRVATVLAALAAVAGLARFARSEAMSGMIEGGQTATVQSALYRLREIVLAEDALRRSAPWDPDGDGIGSAVLMPGLMGRAPFRPGNGPSPPTLNYLFREAVDTPTGPAAKVEGYLYIVCLPTPDGRWTARPPDPVDDERAERRFLAYAWPAETHPGTNTAFFVDEHERILVLDAPRGSPPTFLGAERPPACEDATLSLASPTQGSAAWKVWKNKQPRKSLPGDTAERL